MLAPPLAPTRQSISYSVNLTNAQVPRARLSLGVVVPEKPPTGEAPAAVGAAAATAQSAAQARVAQAQAEAQASLEQVQASLVALEQAQRDGRALENRASDGRSNDLVRLSDGELSDLSQTISTTATSRAESSRPRSPRSAMRWTASEPRSPTTPIGWWPTPLCSTSSRPPPRHSRPTQVASRPKHPST